MVTFHFTILRASPRQLALTSIAPPEQSCILSLGAPHYVLSQNSGDFRYNHRTIEVKRKRFRHAFPLVFEDHTTDSLEPSHLS
jgi:hypothetical protein